MITIFFHNIPDDTRYSFSVAKIRALESKMLDHGLITRLLKSTGVDEMLKILMDTEYRTNLNEVGEAPFESALDNELNRVYNLIRSIDPNPKWTDLWHWRYDAHNIKIILKTSPSNKEAIQYLIPYGVIASKDLIEAFEQSDYTYLPLPIKEAVEEILGGDEKRGKRPQEIDWIIDRALYQFILKEVQKSKNEFLIYLIEILIDFINTEGFLRVKGIQALKDVFHHMFIPGGRIRQESFFTQEEKEPDELIREILKNTPYAGLSAFVDSKNIAALEKAMEDFLITYLRQTRQRAFGVEPLVGYMMAKEMEIKNLRLIYVGKANGLEEGLIKERLRETYV